MFNQSKQRATTRILSKTEGGFKKTNTFHTTRVKTPNHRNFENLKEKIMSQEKRNKSTSKKKNHRTLNIFKGAARTLQVSSPVSIQFNQTSTNNSRKISINNFHHRYLRINRNVQLRSKTPLVDNYFNKSTRNSQHQFIHEKVHQKCLSFVKQISRPSQQIKLFNSFNNKQKILVQLHKQAADFGIELGKKNSIFNKQEKVIKPYIQLTRLGRMFGPSKAEREKFRIDLTSEEEFYSPCKLNKSTKLKKQLKYDQSPFQSTIKNNNVINKLHKQQKTSQIIRVPVLVESQMRYKPFNKVQFKQKIQLSKLQQILSCQDESHQKQLHQNLINKNIKSKILSTNNFIAKQQQKNIQVFMKNQQQKIDDSIVEIRLDTKQSDLIYQDEDNQSDDVTKPISNPSKPKILLQSYQPRIIQPITLLITQDIIKSKNEQIRPIGEIIGHGLKILKGININWILPCVFLYKKFYQLRVQIQNLAQQSEIQNEFICKNRYQNQRILQSYGNMIKAAEKKPITQQKQQKLRQSKITDPIYFQNLIEQIQSYEQDISEFNGKQGDISLIKSHFILILNSVVILGQHQKLIKQSYKVNENNEDIDKQIGKALELIRSLK